MAGNTGWKIANRKSQIVNGFSLVEVLADDCGSAGFPACGFAGLSSPVCQRATGKSPAPADRNVCPTDRRRRTCPAFSLVEVLVAVTLLSLIVLVLMAVFSSTQRAFRAAVTQTDVLEGSRAAMEMIAADLRTITPSYGWSNGAVNFSVLANSSSPHPGFNNLYVPLLQNLPGGSIQRTNLLNYFFMLSRQNTKWIGIGYVVDNTNTSDLFPLYRFYAEAGIQSNPLILYTNFYGSVLASQWTNMSRLAGGVVHLTARAQDPVGSTVNGRWISGVFYPYTNALNTLFFYPPTTGIGSGYGEAQLYMYSNTVPAAVELELGVLEDRALARAQSLPFNSTAQLNFLAQQSGSVHVFRQRVSIPNVDPSAYP